ncbi:Metallo-dependent hydrolase [Violaceomyces palustris]|uniref:Metallo-dependent hydrolase n=1 Tax=Violaceomyces palustris TaxID=1673888 RepID=A0ACD0P658_9BASI|nr:Metallo-dependent hydrolase [Violaceomyces palustris]
MSQEKMRQHPRSQRPINLLPTTVKQEDRSHTRDVASLQTTRSPSSLSRRLGSSLLLFCLLCSFLLLLPSNFGRSSSSSHHLDPLGGPLRSLLVRLLPSISAEERKEEDVNLSRAKRILSKHPLIDGHVDVPVYSRYVYKNRVEDIPFDLPPTQNGTFPMPGQVDIPRLRLGRSGGYFWSAYVACPTKEEVGENFENASKTQAIQETMEQFDVIKQFVDKYPKEFEFTSTAKSARKAFSKGKMISFIGLEGGHSLGNSLHTLRAFASLYKKEGEIVGPMRYLTLTHTCHNVWADSSSEQPPRWNGVSPFGVRLIHELNRLGIVPDLSHTSDSTTSQAIRISKGPVMLSHSSARNLTGDSVVRNVPDSILHQLKTSWIQQGKDNIVMINVLPDFLGGARDLETIVNHVEHISSIVGRDHVGLGTDFDGMLESPIDFQDVTRYPHLVARLLARGWSEKEVIDFSGRNVLRVLESAERLAVQLEREGERPDNSRFEDFFPS